MLCTAAAAALAAAAAAVYCCHTFQYVRHLQSATSTCSYIKCVLTPCPFLLSSFQHMLPSAGVTPQIPCNVYHDHLLSVHKRSHTMLAFLYTPVYLCMLAFLYPVYTPLCWQRPVLRCHEHLCGCAGHHSAAIWVPHFSCHHQRRRQEVHSS